MNVYVVELSWFDDITEELIKPSKNYIFTNAEKALNFVNEVIWNTDTYIKYQKPLDTYLYKVEEGQAVDECLFDRYIAGWYNLDKKIRD